MSELTPSRRRAAYATLIGGYVNIGVVIVQGVLLVPLYLYYIGPKLYGAWLGSGDIVGWLAIADMGLASLMIQRIGLAYGQQNGRLVSQYLTTGLLMQLLMVTLLVAGTVLVSNWIPSLMSIHGVESNVLAGSIILAGVASGFSILSNGVAGFAMALQRTVFMTIAALVGALIGISITVVLLTQGWGLWAIPIGWVAREGCTLIGNGIYAVLLYRSTIYSPLTTSRYVLKDFIVVLPSMFAAKLGGALASRSEAALIAVFIRPEIATLYVLTKRAADIVRMVLDRFGSATFAGFSHLIGSGHKNRAVDVYQEIMGLYTPIAIIAITVYMAINQTFVTVWAGKDMFGGQVLTILIGLAVLTSAGGNLINYLYGATGQIARSSQILLVEGILRLGIMALLLYWLGINGLPLAMILTSMAVVFVTWSWTRRELEVPSRIHLAPQRLLVMVLLLVPGMTAGRYVWADTWLELVVVSIIFSTALMGTMLLVSLPLRTYVAGVGKQIRRKVVFLRNRG